jgi:very-short-patch-repair endonuclease
MGEKRHRLQPRQTSRARSLRREAPPPERLLWSRIRGGRLGGLKFRRQHPIGPFIVDFYCAEAELVVEIDGMSHDKRADEDERRSAYLRGQGCRIVRYTNHEVLTRLDDVLRDIAHHAGVEL